MCFFPPAQCFLRSYVSSSSSDSSRRRTPRSMAVSRLRSRDRNTADRPHDTPRLWSSLSSDVSSGLGGRNAYTRDAPTPLVIARPRSAADLTVALLKAVLRTAHGRPRRPDDAIRAAPDSRVFRSRSLVVRTAVRGWRRHRRERRR